MDSYPSGAATTASEVTPVPEAGDDDRLPNLPKLFWEARPHLAAIRDYARSRRCIPDAALGFLFARTPALMDADVVLNTGVGSNMPPILFAGIVAPSGGGKTSSNQIAKDVLPAPSLLDVKDFAGFGSGEGLAEAFMGTETEEREVNGKPKKVHVRKQMRRNAFFVADEGAAFAKLIARSGSILSDLVRSAFVGEKLGQCNANSETTREVKGYTLGAVISFPPRAAASLLTRRKADNGTPQRFRWFAGTDNKVPDQKPLAALPKLCGTFKRKGAHGVPGGCRDHRRDTAETTEGRAVCRAGRAHAAGQGARCRCACCVGRPGSGE